MKSLTLMFFIFTILSTPALVIFGSGTY